MLRVVVGENVNFSSFAEGVMASQGVQVHLLQVKENFNLNSQKLIIDDPLGVKTWEVLNEFCLRK